MAKIKASIIGANGYTGLELINILCCHANVELSKLACRGNAGEPVGTLFPSLSHLNLTFSSVQSLDDIVQSSDVIFTALPHAASAGMAQELFERAAALNRSIKIIDLSADFRYKNLDVYEATYKVTHPARELSNEAVYGLPELYRTKISTARLIGNPGCYTTSAILPLYPLLKEGAISHEGIVVNSASGTSGAGRKADVSLISTEVEGSYKAYGVTTHRHTSEIEEVLTLSSGKKICLTFTPHLLPIKRGILSTIYADTTLTENKIADIFQSYYKNEEFISLGTLPEIKHVVYSNRCSIGWKKDERTGKLIIISCLDNLIKGASGQAVQNMNLLFGLPESTGLSYPARPI